MKRVLKNWRGSVGDWGDDYSDVEREVEAGNKGMRISGNVSRLFGDDTK
ncbi:hypothetical protein NL418_024955 [Escherichia coli]|nr:hypothetical protein [Escherichia coli]WCQ53427.1 hypothetical protein NL418_024955 [Escherichia coli]